MVHLPQETKWLFNTKTVNVNAVLTLGVAILTFAVDVLPKEAAYMQFIQFALALIQRWQVDPIAAGASDLKNRPEVAAHGTMALGIAPVAVALGAIPWEALVTTLITAVANLFLARVTDTPAKLLPPKK